MQTGVVGVAEIMFRRFFDLFGTEALAFAVEEHQVDVGKGCDVASPRSAQRHQRKRRLRAVRIDIEQRLPGRQKQGQSTTGPENRWIFVAKIGTATAF